MGKQALIIVLSLSLGFGIIGIAIYGKENRAVTNYVNYYERMMARNVGNSTMQLALRQLADSGTWRTGYKKLKMLGGEVTLTLKDSTFYGEKGIKLGCSAKYGNSSYIDTAFVKFAGGWVPPSVRAAFTAFGPLDKSISDMYVDGRDHDTSGNVLSQNGLFAVSTGAPSFVCLEPTYLGGTDRTSNPYSDIVPAFPFDSRTVETSSKWDNGFPRNADEAIGVPKGTLVKVAKSGVGGSRYLINPGLLTKAPVRGVTYVQLPPGSAVSITLPPNPTGILVFHSDSVDAFAKHVDVSGGSAFKGLMIFDKVFHMHLDVYGAVLELTENTVLDRECNGNRDHKIYYSSKWVENATSILAPSRAGATGGWRSKFQVLSWME